jgi:hypothetical protein
MWKRMENSIYKDIEAELNYATRVPETDLFDPSKESILE